MWRTDHPPVAELAALAHGEPSPGRPAVDAHVARCDACRGTVDALRRDDAEAAALLRLLDHAPPSDALDRVLTAARRPRPVAHRPVGRIAAVSLLTIAGAAAALPHSPLRRLLTRSATPAPAPRAAAPIAPRDSTPPGAGIAMIPGDRLDVVFLRPARGRVVVRLVDDAQLALRPQGGAVAFAVRADRIEVDDSAARASFVLTVPRTLRQLRIHVDTALVLAKDAAHVVTRAPRDEARDAYSVDLAVPGASHAPRGRP